MAKNGSNGRPIGVGPHNARGGKPAKGEARAHVDARRAKTEILELAGASVRQIAAETEVSVKTAFEDLQAVRRKRHNQLIGRVVNIEDERLLELARLEQQRSRLLPLAEKAMPGAPLEVQRIGLAAHRELLNVAKRKADLVGLDAPVRVVAVADPYEAIRTGLDRKTLAAIALREPGQIIDLPDSAVVSDTDSDVDPDP